MHLSDSKVCTHSLVSLLVSWWLEDFIIQVHCENPGADTKQVKIKLRLIYWQTKAKKGKNVNLMCWGRERADRWNRTPKTHHRTGKQRLHTRGLDLRRGKKHRQLIAKSTTNSISLKVKLGRSTSYLGGSTDHLATRSKAGVLLSRLIAEMSFWRGTLLGISWVRGLERHTHTYTS